MMTISEIINYDLFLFSRFKNFHFSRILSIHFVILICESMRFTRQIIKGLLEILDLKK
jgi:hypothetical protein